MFSVKFGCTSEVTEWRNNFKAAQQCIKTFLVTCKVTYYIPILGSCYMVVRKPYVMLRIPKICQRNYLLNQGTSLRIRHLSHLIKPSRKYQRGRSEFASRRLYEIMAFTENCWWLFLLQIRYFPFPPVITKQRSLNFLLIKNYFKSVWRD